MVLLNTCSFIVICNYQTVVKLQLLQVTKQVIRSLGLNNNFVKFNFKIKSKVATL